MKPQCKILNCITKMGLPEKLRKNNTSAFTCTQADYSVYYSGKEFKINKWSNHQPSSDNKNNCHNHRNHRAGLVHRPTTMCTVLPRQDPRIKTGFALPTQCDYNCDQAFLVRYLHFCVGPVVDGVIHVEKNFAVKILFFSCFNYCSTNVKYDLLNCYLLAAIVSSRSVKAAFEGFPLELVLETLQYLVPKGKKSDSQKCAFLELIIKISDIDDFREKGGKNMEFTESQF